MVDVAAPKPGDASKIGGDAIAPRMGDDLRKKVWNNTTKLFRMPNNQVILPKNFNNIAGWDIWKDHDVVKSWLMTGALTEDEPLAPPEGEVLATFTALSAAPSVFSGKVEPVRAPSPEPKEAPKPPQGSSPSPGGLKPSPGPSPARP
jgi:hypothetical protein